MRVYIKTYEKKGEFKMKQWWKNPKNKEIKDNRGVGVIEIILILVVLIALVLIFRKQLETFVVNIFKKINATEKEFEINTDITPIAMLRFKFLSMFW